MAGVGKPAIYRRFDNKAALVADLISRQLPGLDVPDIGDTRAELQLAVQRGRPADGPGYVRLIGGLIAEQDRHPELIDAFREKVLLPRRAVVLTVLERGRLAATCATTSIRRRCSTRWPGHSWPGCSPVSTGPRWRETALETWWQIFRTKGHTT